MTARTLVLTMLAALTFAAPASATPPTLLSVGSDRLHVTARFAVAGADSVTIYISKAPDRATDGSFLSENLAGIDFLTDHEIASGVWMDEDTLAPGTYYAMLSASTYLCSQGAACVDGFPNVMTLTVPKPKPKYRAKVERGFVGEFTLTVTPLGESLPYRLCWNRTGKRRKCERDTIAGYDWTSAASDSILLTVDDLKISRRQARVKFTWYVGKRRVASKTVRIRRS
jgi:hypothetical protein